MTPRRYFLDISGSMIRVQKRDLFSGVQRMVMTLGHELAQITTPDQLFITWYERKQKAYVCLPYAALAPGVLLDARAMRATFYPHVHQRMLNKSGAKQQDTTPARKLGAYFKSLAALGVARNKAEFPPAPPSHALAQTARSGDVLLMMDLSPDPRRDDALHALRPLGMRNVTLVHDLIPLVTPYFVTSRTSEKFHAWLMASQAYTDLYLANSQATRIDLQAFMDHTGCAIPIKTLPLAQDRIPAIAGESAEASNTVQAPYELMQALTGHDGPERALAGTPFVLCVGTIEPRKNNWRIALAWQKLLQAGHSDLPKLVFAGRVTEGSQALFELLGSRSGGLDGYVEIIDGPSDAALELLYRQCQFTIQASLYEGWGLPVGEGLSYGKTGVVSARTSLPEVGGDLVVYCDPERIDSIADAVETLLQPETRMALEGQIAQGRLRSWADVAADLMDVVRAEDHM